MWPLLRIRQPSDTTAERDFVRRLLPFSALDLRTRSGARGGAALGKYIIVRPRLFLTLIPAIPTQIPTCPLSLNSINRKDSNLQPDRYERCASPGKAGKI